MDFTHFNENGRARMVDVSEKDETKRKAYRDAICDAKMGKIGRTEGY